MKTLKPSLQTLKTGPQSLSKTTQQTKFAQERTRGRTWMAIRERVLLTEPICYKCKEKGLITPAKEVDHIKPLFLGGTDDMENLAGICIPCHKSKSIKERGQIKKPAIGVDGWPVDYSEGIGYHMGAGGECKKNEQKTVHRHHSSFSLLTRKNMG